MVSVFVMEDENDKDETDRDSDVDDDGLRSDIVKYCVEVEVMYNVDSDDDWLVNKVVFFKIFENFFDDVLNVDDKLIANEFIEFNWKWWIVVRFLCYIVGIDDEDEWVVSRGCDIDKFMNEL